MSLAELLEYRREIVQGDADHARKAERTIEGAPGNPKTGSEALKAGKNITAGLEINDSFGGQGEGISCPVDQRNPKLFFHDAYLLTHRALGDAACFRRSGKAAGVAQIAEDLESLNIHGAEFDQ